MRWKRFQRAIWTLLAVCAVGVFLMCVVSGRGYTLVFGQVDDGTIAWTLVSIFLLALVVWGDGAIVAFTRGWERVVFLVFCPGGGGAAPADGPVFLGLFLYQSHVLPDL